MANDAVELTREELYEKVWTTPIVQLAREYGMSDVGLAKICKKLNIPRPGLGYWRRVQTGQKPKRAKLPVATKETPAVATIRRHEKGEGPVDAGSEAQALITAELAPDRRIVVGESLRGSHPLVSRTNAAFSGSGASGHGGINEEMHLDLSISKAAAHRALRIFDALIKGLEARGFSVSIEKGTLVEVMGEKVRISMQERFARHERELTAEEERKKREGRLYYISDRYSFNPTGELKLQIENIPYSCSNIQKTWGDTKHQRLEDRLNDFVGGLITASAAIRKARLAWEEKERRWREEERRQAEAEKRRREEEARRQRLHHQVESWAKSSRMRSFIAAVRSQVLEGSSSFLAPERLDEWCEWATGQADALDPLKGSSAQKSQVASEDQLDQDDE